MYVKDSKCGKVILSCDIEHTGYGCCFSWSEFTLLTILKLLYFKIRHELRVRLIKWVMVLEKLFPI